MKTASTIQTLLIFSTRLTASHANAAPNVIMGTIISGSLEDTGRSPLARRSHGMGHMKPKIIVAFDFSDTAERALAWAADLQRTTGSPPLHLVHAISSLLVTTAQNALEMVLPSAEEMRTFERDMVEKARRHEATATAAVKVGPSSIGDLILDAAGHAGAELIVMGSHGRTGVRRLLLGSVAEHVLRHADCPVVTIRGARDMT